MVFVDTNYFLRFFLKDVKNQYQQAKKLLENGALGTITVFTTTTVLFETEWVLDTMYKMNKSERVKVLLEILAMDYLHIHEREIITAAVEQFTTYSIELVDAYHIELVKKLGIKQFKTFDKKLQKIFLESAN